MTGHGDPHPPGRPLAALAGLLLCIGAGCGAGARHAHPDPVLARYVLALERGDIEAAYDLLSSEQQATTSRAELRAAAEAHPEEVREQARQLRMQLEDPIPVRAEMQGSRGETATFVLERGSWRIVEGAAGSVALDTPRQAVRALRRALQARSYQGLVRVLGRETRASVEDEISRIVDGLADEEALRIEVTGNRARVVYDDDHFVDLAREDGEWVVVDMD